MKAEDARRAKAGYERFVASLEKVTVPDETQSMSVWPGWNELAPQTRLAWLEALSVQPMAPVTGEVIYQDNGTRVRISVTDTGRIRLDVDHAETILTPFDAVAVHVALLKASFQARYPNGIVGEKEEPCPERDG